MKNIYKIFNINQNIYITSDEEIKEGDYFICGEEILKCTGYYSLTQTSYVKCNKGDCSSEICKKIILTTDQDLIKDGVQAIDDEFLEWFVNNPSCEKVEVVKDRVVLDDVNYNFDIVDYKCKIIIPKEEPKQDLEKEMFELEQELDIPSHLRWHNSKPRQETLEEAAEKFAKKFGIEIDSTRYYAFINGAKWQQERMYSEEDMEDYSNYCWKLSNDNRYKTPLSPKEWFEQFKKK